MRRDNSALVLLRGGGDLATGVALRLHRAGIKVIITELAQPLAVRRTVSFAEADYEGQHVVEEVTARLVKKEQPRPEFYRTVSDALEVKEIPVLIDPNADVLSSMNFPVVIDGRLTKQTPPPLPVPVPLHIGLGPGFHAGSNCHAVIETRRSHTLGRVYWNGSTQADSRQPEGDPRRVLRASMHGILMAHKQIGEHCETGDLIAEIQSEVETQQSEIRSPFAGVLRGLIRAGIHVTKELKIGDVDPRDDASACFLVSDKALAIGGAVLEALLTKPEIRDQLWK